MGGINSGKSRWDKKETKKRRCLEGEKQVDEVAVICFLFN